MRFVQKLVQKMKDIWQVQKQVTTRLLVWSGLSVVAGLALQLASPFWRAFGAQAFGWGAIDAAIALFGDYFARRRKARLSHPLAPDVVARETRNLRRILWFNAGLDVFYVLGGVWLARGKGRSSAQWRGHGRGIVVQGVFLFMFDLFHALHLRRFH
jgi:hypothetical protein